MSTPTIPMLTTITLTDSDQENLQKVWARKEQS